ncbi:hypothetical protein A7K94_0220925, partial [Modestobacter sp. VKM Ac-2676]
MHSVATFPLIARGELFGAVTLVTGPERGAFTEAELRTADIMSRRAGLALDNARLATAQTRVAERLQRSLLSPPVQPDALELAVRYRPAAQDVSIGGDWYDSFLQPDGATVLVIGDVMGHDLERPRRWRSCAPWCGPSPTTGRPDRARCCGGSTAPWSAWTPPP